MGENTCTPVSYSLTEGKFSTVLVLIEEIASPEVRYDADQLNMANAVINSNRYRATELKEIVKSITRSAA